MKSPGPNVTVVTEVGYCPFCQRSRNLRRELRHLGALVRNTVECESCHRTLSSTIGPPPAELEKEEAAPETPQPVAEDAAKPAAAKPAAKRATAAKASPAKARPAAGKTAAKTAGKTAAAKTKSPTAKKK